MQHDIVSQLSKLHPAGHTMMSLDKDSKKLKDRDAARFSKAVGLLDKAIGLLD